MRLLRENQEKQRRFHGQFQFQGVAHSGAVEEIPGAVDLLGRPDCMEDVIAFATAVCSLGSEYVLPFWSKDTHVREGDDFMTLVPSRALKDLEVQQQNDESLYPSYLSFLAALALAKNPCGGDGGAEVVHSMLDWPSLIDTLRWYVRELDPQAYAARGSSTSKSSSQATASTAYYYFDQANSASDQTSKNRSSGDSSPRSQPRELGEVNTFILLSHLAVISNVAAKSSDARSAIVSINLPITNSDGSVVGQDSAMMVLFSLTLLPLTPEVRGAVFGTLSQLLSVDGSNKEQAADMRTAALKGWEHLEACQIIPIRKLEQYPSTVLPGTHTTAGIAFPLSSFK